MAATQIYALRNKNFRESLEEDHPSLDAAASNAASEKYEDGAEVVARQLDSINSRFETVAERLTSRLKTIGKQLEEERGELDKSDDDDPVEEEEVEVEDIKKEEVGDGLDVTKNKTEKRKKWKGPDAKVS